MMHLMHCNAASLGSRKDEKGMVFSVTRQDCSGKNVNNHLWSLEQFIIARDSVDLELQRLAHMLQSSQIPAITVVNYRGELFGDFWGYSFRLSFYNTTSYLPLTKWDDIPV
jgi:hypothetical protein